MTRALLTAVTLAFLILSGPGGCPTDGVPIGDPNSPGGVTDPNGWDPLGDPNWFVDVIGDPNDGWDPFADPNFWVEFGDPNWFDDPNSGGQEADGGSLALFDQVWRDFDETYSYFTYKGVDWDALKDQYRPDFADDLSADAFAEKIAVMLRELNDFHVSVQKPDGTYVEVYTRDVARNYTSTPRNRYRVSEYATLGEDVVWHAWYTDNIAYIRVDTFDSAAFEAISDQDIEGIFTTYASAEGLIFDIRANAGGNENNAAAFVSHFTDQTRTYGYTRTRNGPDHGDFDPLQTKTLEPSSGARFLKPVACLIGERCMSSAEWCTLMAKACPNITLIGDTTRGSSGNPKGFSLPNGVRYTVPTWIAYTDEQVAIEDRGIEPDIAIDPQSSIDDSHDYVIERAIAELTN